MIIRELEREDFDSAMECYKDGIDLGICTFNSSVPSYEKWNNGHFKYGRFVCEMDGKIVGFVCLCPFAIPDFYHGVQELSIYVRNGYNHLGIGSKLMDALIKCSEENGVWTLVAHIMAENTRSIEFHKKFGFKVVGVREKLGKNSNGVWMDTVLMERRSEIL